MQEHLTSACLATTPIMSVLLAHALAVDARCPRCRIGPQLGCAVGRSPTSNCRWSGSNRGRVAWVGRLLTAAARPETANHQRLTTFFLKGGCVQGWRLGEWCVRGRTVARRPARANFHKTGCRHWESNPGLRRHRGRAPQERCVNHYTTAASGNQRSMC